ncbi:MAG: bifunctional hydroxymethylpyrimidine kinase/phosphomethylpyrimidine kinase [Ardenticatenaceae bacterium]|nr:bifunctional hydroxymethylpyrimidine kinase/phosphomethylpyrimidine kinase [Ardenticatenaceae bacterium]MCB9444123.1 bifunctional hydroxymethylpyrimidine kinase/phosphomethylpyrimidine kinase [Ardenticatenaceae bacterium]
MNEPVKVLTIAGSDSGGAAGLQADLKTWAALGMYGMSVVSVVTAQNSMAVTAVHPLPLDFVAAELDAVLTDYGAAAVKTGFLGRVDLIQTIAAKLSLYQLCNIVIDPVLVNHKGQAMFSPEVTQAYIDHLLPLADLITPNRREAELLTGLSVQSVMEMETAVIHLHAFGPKYVLLKGGRDGDELVDLFYDGTAVTQFRSPRIDTINTHGSGDTLSAAVCAFLAQGMGMETAVYKAHQFTHQAIQRAASWQLGHGHGPVAPYKPQH